MFLKYAGTNFNANKLALPSPLSLRETDRTLLNDADDSCCGGNVVIKFKWLKFGSLKVGKIFGKAHGREKK